MTCAEAQLLLDQGVIPGSTPGRNVPLGFHLAGCAECRAFRAQCDQALLAELVALPPDTPLLSHPEQPHTTLVPVVPQPRSAPRSRAGRRLMPTAALLLIACGGLVGFGLWYVGLPLYRAYANLHTSYRAADQNTVARRVFLPAASEAATPLILPTLTSTPTETPRPTETPLPTATPTLVPTVTPVPTPTLPPVRPMTIVLLGLDARAGEGLQARSDALMLTRLDPVTGAATLLSMPRDLWVPIPGFGEGKINGAFYAGERFAAGGGMNLAGQTIAQAFGVEIDHAVVIDFNGFRSLIDALGGITVDVPKEIYDGHFPTDDYGYTVAHFLPGPQQMDGATALTYARIRHPDSDFERIKRQQLVLIGIAQKIKERGVLQNLHEADLLTQSLTPFVTTDMPPATMLSLLWSMRNLDPANVQRFWVDGSMLWETTVGGAYALVPRQGVLQSLGQKLLTPAAP